MQSVNRKKAPQFKQVEDFYSLKVESFSLENGIPVYFLNSGLHEIIKLDVVFEAGQWFSRNPLVADYSNHMMIEGSKHFSSSEIADKLDFYGSFVNFENGKHFANAQLYSLGSFFGKSLEIFQDLIKHPVYPEKEFKVQMQNEYQQFILSREKTEIMAADAFYPKLFGEEHPYGRVRKSDDFESLKIEQLKAYHKRYYNSENCKIIVSGNLNEKIKQILQSSFGGDDWKAGNEEKKQEYIGGKSKPGRYIIRKDGAVQASLKLGCSIIDKKHPDFHGLSILNTILGGYFGSRLMMNLREKNALTYGIHSSLISFLKEGIFLVSANVNGNQASDAIEHIYKEIEILQTKPVPAQELQMVKNYLSGEMLRAFDGPLLQSEIYAGLLNYQLDFDYYKQYFKTLKTINADTLKRLANTYFVKENFVEILAGNIEE